MVTRNSPTIPTKWFVNIPKRPRLKSLHNICDWSQRNKSCINITKTKEPIFHGPYPIKFDLHQARNGIFQEHVAKLLGVFFCDNLRFEEHVDFVLTVCS